MAGLRSLSTGGILCSWRIEKYRSPKIGLAVERPHVARRSEVDHDLEEALGTDLIEVMVKFHLPSHSDVTHSQT